MDLLVEEGVTSFKLFMAYPGVFYSDDGQILRAMQRVRRQRRADHDARRERHRHRRPRRAGARPRARPTRATTARSARRCWRPRPPTAPSSSPGSPGAPALRRARLGGGGRRRAGAGPRQGAATSSARPVRSTCSCPPTTSPSRTSRAPSTSAPRRCGPGSTRRRCGGGCGPTTSRSSPPTTARSASAGQKELGRGDFSKIPNGLPGVENRMDLLHQAVVDGHIIPPPLDRDRLRDPGPDVRPLPEEGHHRPGRRRRRRHLRPARRADPLRRDPPHERRLLGVRGQARSPGGSRPCSRAARSSSTSAEYTGRGRARPVHPARHLSVPELGARRMDFGLVLQTDPPASAGRRR